MDCPLTVHSALQELMQSGIFMLYCRQSYPTIDLIQQSTSLILNGMGEGEAIGERAGRDEGIGRFLSASKLRADFVLFN
jgi:hypothetical protein